MIQCPTCKGSSKREGNKSFPFCSERCQLIDLGKWLDEEYRIPVEESGPSSSQITPESSEE